MIKYPRDCKIIGKTIVVKICDGCGLRTFIQARAIKAVRKRGVKLDRCYSCCTKDSWKVPNKKKDPRIQYLLKHGHKPPKLPFRICPVCKTGFHPWFWGTKYCSRKCYCKMARPTAEGIKKLSKTMSDGRMCGKNNHMYGRPAPHGKIYKWKGVKFRSSWEVKYAKWLSGNGIWWLYEPEAFPVGGGRTFRPDFYLPQTDEWVEIKGFWRDDAKLRWCGFCRKYSRLSKRLLKKNDLLKLGVL